jgi:polyhydroxyalkanoate synthesis regulator phasin
MSTKKKVAAIVITTVALTAGTVGISSASSKTTKASVTRVTTARTIAGANVMQSHGAEIATVLADLVTKGTITQTQANAITAALAAAEAAEHANAPQRGMKVGPGFAGPGKPDRASTLALISSTIGIDSVTIKNRLAAGETLAAIAGAKKELLITALVAEETKRIDAAVTAGKLTAAQATTLKSTLTAHVTDEVNSTPPVAPMGPKGPRGHGPKSSRGHDGPMRGQMGGTTLTLPAPPTA